MASTSLTGITFFLLCLFLFSFSCTTARYTGQRFQTISVDRLLPSRLCDSTTEGIHNDVEGNSVLQLIDRHGPCSPFNATAGRLIHDLRQDQSRVDLINSRISSSSSPNTSQKEDLLFTDAATRLPAYRGTSLGSGNFIVNVGLGTPKKDFSLVFDTGSDLTWVQCSPCLTYCYQQQGPRFAPSASSTYKSIPCSAQECNEAALESGVGGCSTSSNICIYGMLYGDRSMSVGYLSRDTLTLSKNDVVPSFTFGCGHRNMGLFGMTGGILGLGRGKLSVLSQAGQKYSSIFSYCLPTSGAVGYLAFGPDSMSYTSVRFTPLLAGYKLYHLSITGMSVGGRLLPISASMFARSGAIIDSGTVITRLPPAIYAALRSAVRTVMAKYKLTVPLEILDTCYDLSEHSTFDYPPIAFHFQGGAELALDASNIFYTRSLEQVCLAFAANINEQSFSIIGNWQQKRTLVVHDIAHSRIGFKPNACA